MKENILIVEDEVIVAKALEMLLEEAGYNVCGIAVSVIKAMEIIEAKKPELVLLDIYLKGNLSGIDLAETLNEKNIAFVYLSANSNQSVLEAAKKTKPYGFMVKPFREQDVLIALDIARERHRDNVQADLQKELILEKQLAGLCNPVDSFDQNLLALVRILQPFIPFDYVELGRFESDENNQQWCSYLRLGLQEYQTIGTPELLNILHLTDKILEEMRDACIHEIRQAIFNQADFAALVTGNVLKKHYADTFQVRSNMVLPLLIDHKRPFILSFYSKSEQVFEPSMLQFLGRIQQSLISTISTILSTPSKPDPGLTEKTARLFNEMPDQSNFFPGIIGKSQPILTVLDYARQVAVADTSVLLLGETGTGKEKIANYIHWLSQRSNQQMVKVNCAALAGTLIESELFGHEKGAFTGAISKRMGRFEQAIGGTLFLDEIGDVPMDIQVKLLRVLQEKEFERIGGNETIKVDVRIIAATNKNLEKEIAEGRFRMDLYYRLNVFPITLPPLRRRKEDIPSLVNYFINIYAEKYQKKIVSTSATAMEQLMRYDWPGNIRELENSIERSMVLTRGEQIEQTFIRSAQENQLSSGADIVVKSIEEVEKAHIQLVLIKCNQKIYGPGGAAEMLNLPPSTLTSKIKKLGIGKEKG